MSRKRKRVDEFEEEIEEEEEELIIEEMNQHRIPDRSVESNKVYMNDVVRMEKKLRKKTENLSKKEVKDLVSNLMEEDVPIQRMDCNTRQRVFSTQTFEALSEIFIAYMMREDPDRFEREPNKMDKTFFFPIDWKVYFYVALFNVSFERAKIAGDYGSEWSRLGRDDSYAIPDCLFGYLESIGGFKSEDGCNGTLQLQVAATPLVENLSVFGPYDPSRLNSASFPEYQGIATSNTVLNFWEYDSTAQEALIVGGETIAPVTVWQYFDDLVTSEKILKMSSYLSKNYATKRYCELYSKGTGRNVQPRKPQMSKVVNLFSQVDRNRAVINPFPGFDVYFSSIYTFFEESPQLFIPHQEFIELPATVPNDEGDALEFEPNYILVEYVQQCQDMGMAIGASSDDLWGISPSDKRVKMKIQQKRFIYRDINAGALNHMVTTDAAAMQGQLEELNSKAMSGSTKLDPIRSYKELQFISTNYWMRRLCVSSPNTLLAPMRAAIPKGVENSIVPTSSAFATFQMGRVYLKHKKHSEIFVPYLNFENIAQDWWSLSVSNSDSLTGIRKYYASPIRIIGDALEDRNYIRYGGVRIDPSWINNINSLPADRLPPALPFHSTGANFDNFLIKSTTQATPALDDYSANFRDPTGGPCMLAYFSWDREDTNTLYPKTEAGAASSNQFVAYRRLAPTRVGTPYPSVGTDASLQIALPLSMDNTTFLSDTVPYIANLCRGSITGLKAGLVTPYENLSAAQWQSNAAFSRRVTELQTKHNHVQDIDGISFYASNDQKCQFLAALTELAQSGAGMFVELVSTFTGVEEGTIIEVASDVADVFIAAGDTITNTKSITDISSQESRVKKAELKTAKQEVSRKEQRKNNGKQLIDIGKNVGKSVKKWSDSGKNKKKGRKGKR